MHDLIVIGAGPAGLAAADAAASAGLSVLLLDGAPRPGGQYWRHRPGDRGPDWPLFLRLTAGLDRVDCRFDTRVWLVEPGFTVHTSRGSFPGRRLIIATGAHDRVIPFPGWELPGVVTAGAAQAMLKGQGVVIGRRVVVAGTGPFLLPVAAGLAAAGATVPAVCESNALWGYLRRPPALGKALEAFGYGVRLARHRVPYRAGWRVVAARGTSSVSSVVVASRHKTLELPCDVLTVGHGFTPQVELAVTLGCETTLDIDGSLVLRESLQRTNVPAVFVAGEVTGVGGASLAVVEGRLAGLAAAGADAPARLVRRRNSLRRFASLLASVHRPPGLPQASDTVLCRCEQVTLEAVCEAVDSLGVVDARGAKLMTRAGMGWCQGRTCGYSVSCALASAMGRPLSADDMRAFANRPIAQPVPLSELPSD